ncbi:YsnF/AvaK domain-containing protein [uncultured Sphingomonas sp.]|uniref:YsnF/AvaK domain-containing protein n=1 Tax=uncultured Sphingomonas sp. TaxID=158754 RepID=UPI0035C9B6E9
MSRTLTALFDSRSDAEAAKTRLEAASIDISGVHVHDQASTGYSESTAYSSNDNKGFWSNLKGAFLPDEDRHTYEEGIKRGGALLTAEVDESDADEAVRVLESANTIDLDDRSDSWRQSGWDYEKSRGPSTGTGAGVGAAVGSALGMGASKGSDMSDRLTTDRVGNEERIDIVQEDLVVGKREVNRGGVRVRSYMVETPVHEQVTLHEEHVEVERRPVDRKLGATDADAFREREISMTETAEEAVVGKTARVVEEVVVRKEGSDRTETIDDTVRRTEVDIDDADTTRTGLGTSGVGTSGVGSTDKGLGSTGTGMGGSGLGSGNKTDRDRY